MQINTSSIERDYLGKGRGMREWKAMGEREKGNVERKQEKDRVETT